MNCIKFRLYIVLIKVQEKKKRLHLLMNLIIFQCTFPTNCVPSFTAIARGRSCAPREPPAIPPFKIADVCKPGNTLLWDLLQDDKIVCSDVRYSFI